MVVQKHYNCAGYALGTFQWYHPYYEEQARLDDAIAFLEEGYSSSEIIEMILKQDIEYILYTVKGIRLHRQYEEIKPDKNIIAYKIGIKFYEQDGEVFIEDIDFHFVKGVILDDPVWTHKCGSGRIEKFTQKTEGDWVIGDFTYTSRTVYFVKENN